MFWDPLFDRISELAGAPPDQCKLITALVVSFPLASAFVRLPPSRPNIAHWFSLVVTGFFLGPFLGLWWGLLELLASTLAVYVIVAAVRGPNMPWIAFMVAMGHLTWIHIRREFILDIPVTTIEVSAMQMVLVMKLTMFAWNVHDGRQKVETLDDSQRATRLTNLPNPLAYLGYCFFFPSVLVGPSFDYATYDALITHTIYNAPIPGEDPATADTKRRRRPHGRRRVAYLHLVIGLLFLAFFATWGARGEYTRILGPDWPEWSILTRFGFVQFCGFVARTKYYAAWSLSEGACILTGLGFNGYDPKTGRTLWNRVRNINILSIESAESFKVLFDSWNCRTNVWLRDCVYKRLAKKGQKPGPVQSMATFVTSAFWHGIAPGYYLAFVTAGLYQYLGKQFRNLVRPYVLPASSPGAAKSPHPALKRLYDLAGWFMVQVNLNYVASAFLLLKARWCIQAWIRMGWYGHLTILVALGFFRLTRRTLRKGIPPRVPRLKPVGVAAMAEAAGDVAGVTSPEGRGGVPSFTLSPPTPGTDRDGEREDPDGPDEDLEWVRHDLHSMSASDRGRGPDGGVVDYVLSGLDTRPGTPKKEL